MPTTYAHDLFGKRVYQKSGDKIQKVIKENQALFQIGVHGPDILFYYKPFAKNEISAIGSKMHQDIAAPYFLEWKRRYQENKDDAMLAYILGFLCHFMLDSTCHPYINGYVAEGRATHDAVETDFDRYLMEKTAKDIYSFKPGNAIIPSEEAASVIAKVIDGVSEKQILKSLKGIRFYTGITVGNKLYRGFLLKAAKLIGFDSYAKGRVFLADPYEDCKESTEVLSGLYEKAVPEAVKVIQEFMDRLEDPDVISERFSRNYE